MIEGAVELYRSLQVATKTSLNGQLNVLLQAVNMLGTGLFAGGCRILGGSLSVVGGVEMSSCLCVASDVAFGSALSSSGAVFLASSLSVRAFVSVGASLSVFDTVTMGSLLSTVGLTYMASSLTVEKATTLRDLLQVAGLW